MRLVERHIIKTQDARYKELNTLTILSKNLYNASLYAIRQYFFSHKTYLNYYELNKEFVSNKNVDYYNLPSKVSQQTLKCVEQNFKSFFSLLKLKSGNISIPKYLPKDGRFQVIYTSQAISKIKLKKGIVKLSGTNIEIPTKQKDIQQVRVVPKGNHIVVEVIYNQECKPKIVSDNLASIDIGLNNLAAISYNNRKGELINGKPLKSINQFYNKKKSKLQIKNKSSKRVKSLTLKRDNKITDYLHKSSRYIINQLVSNNVSALIIGKNNGWKQEIKLGKVNNQNFVQIPHARFIQMLEYKANLEGIQVILQEESYTSLCSFLDNEPVKKHDTYVGKRNGRLFTSFDGKVINSDINGSLNIMRKAVTNVKFTDVIEVCSTPSVFTVK